MSHSHHPPPFVGVILLDTRFPRPPGDMGQPVTYARAGIPVRFARVPRATVQRVVREADPALLAPFVQAARQLESEGAGLIITSCGFLARHQQALQAAVKVPVITSSLLQCQDLAQPGIVTFEAASLSSAVLSAAEVPANTPVSGLKPQCSMHLAISEDLTEMDFGQACSEVVEAAQTLVQAHPQVRSIVLECTNMPPYRQAVAQATGRPVHDLETMLLQRWPTIVQTRR